MVCSPAHFCVQNPTFTTHDSPHSEKPASFGETQMASLHFDQFI